MEKCWKFTWIIQKIVEIQVKIWLKWVKSAKNWLKSTKKCWKLGKNWPKILIIELKLDEKWIKRTENWLKIMKKGRKFTLKMK